MLLDGLIQFHLAFRSSLGLIVTIAYYVLVYAFIVGLRRCDLVSANSVVDIIGSCQVLVKCFSMIDLEIYCEAFVCMLLGRLTD